MNDMTQVIIPRSDQINADSLLAGPITITITSVDIKPGEQPVTIHYEGEDGKPWRPCKSMARCMVAAWGPDASKYTGRSLTLYCDPKVRWGGLEVGGIRISHMSHIEAPMTLALTVTRGNKKPFIVKPIERAASQPEALITEDQATELELLCTEGGRDLTAEFKTRAGIEKFAQLSASKLKGAKKWIADERGKEMQADLTSGAGSQP